MATFELTGPDGGKFEIDAPDERAAIAAFKKFNGAPATADAPAPPLAPGAEVSPSSVVRATAKGVPIVGGVLNKMNAATNAALAPVLNPLFSEKDQLTQPTFSERYGASLKQQEGLDKAFEEENPILDTGLQVAGGVASTLPLMATAAGAKAFGVTGKTIPAMAAGGATGAAIGGVDAAVRGHDPTTGAVIGGAFGSGGALLGKGIGAAYDKARGAVRNDPVVPQHVVDVNGVPVPMSESAITRDPSAAAREQVMLRGGAGDPAQAVATGARDETLAALKTAEERFAAGLDPVPVAPGAPPRAAVTPETAGQTVATDLVALEQQRAAGEATRVAASNAERAALRDAMDPPGAVAAPDTPFSMGEAVSTGIQTRAQQAAAARTAAYERVAQIPGEFEPAVFQRAGTAIRDRLNGGHDPVRITERTTPNAADALTVIDEQLGHLRFEDLTRRGEMVVGAGGRPVPRPITSADVEATRKQLVALQRQANQAARAPGGSAEDARAMRRVMEEFDAHKRRGIQAGGFSGDGPALLRAEDQARALHSEFRRNFSSHGPGDKVGRTIEDIIGRYPGQEITPDKIVTHILGSANEPGGGNTVQLVQRLRNLLGDNSPEWASIRKAAVSHMTEAPAGLDPVSHVQQADRIMKLLNGTKGRMLAQTLFTPGERTRLADYANRIRTVVDPVPTNPVERMIARMSGRDGSPPASTTEVVNQLFDLKANKETAVQLARELKNRLAPESFGQVKQGMWSRLTQAPEGMIPWESQRVSQNLHNFLKSELAKTIYTPNERMLMKTIADAHSKMIPVSGSTNPSGTAPMLSRIAKGAQNQLLGLFGFSHGGLPGAGIAIAAGKGLNWLGNRKAANEATKLFYGEQPKAPSSKAARQLAIIAAQSTTAQRERSR